MKRLVIMLALVFTFGVPLAASAGPLNECLKYKCRANCAERCEVRWAPGTHPYRRCVERCKLRTYRCAERCRVRYQ